MGRVEMIAFECQLMLTNSDIICIYELEEPLTRTAAGIISPAPVSMKIQNWIAILVSVFTK
jgi:hypothetical protein